jgi:hypothetical protein
MNRLFALLAGSLLWVSPAVAETPVVDLYAGYSILNDEDFEETFTKGFVVSAAFSVSDSVAIPVEFSWHSKDFEFLDRDALAVGVKSYMAGFRFGRRFYAQVLAGGVTGNVEISGFGSESESNFALQPGLGLDLKLGVVGVRLGADYRRVFSDPGVNEWRGHAGLVLYLGSR